MILNNNERITEEELELLSRIKNKNHIIVINKTDLENKLDLIDAKLEYSDGDTFIDLQNERLALLSKQMDVYLEKQRKLETEADSYKKKLKSYGFLPSPEAQNRCVKFPFSSKIFIASSIDTVLFLKGKSKSMILLISVSISVKASHS